MPEQQQDAEYIYGYNQLYNLALLNRSNSQQNLLLGS